MAQNIPNIDQAKVLSSLDTYQYTVLSNGVYEVQMTVMPLSLPSSIIIQIKQNSSVITTSPAPSANQQVMSQSASINCVANDVISVILSSSQASDTGRNAFKGILDIHVGSKN